MGKKRRSGLSRRELLGGAALTGAIAAGGGGASAGATRGPQEPEPVPVSPPGSRLGPAWENLSAGEAELLEAIADELIPADENGPGALDAQAVRYIDRALSGPEVESRDAYRSGLAAFDRYCRSSRGAPFLELSPRDRISVLIDVETGAATGARAGFVGSSAAFFAMVRRHVLQGTFGDPYYGGNAGYVGWNLLGYPGLRISVTAADQRRLEAGELTPVRRSAYDWDSFHKAEGGFAEREDSDDV